MRRVKTCLRFQMLDKAVSLVLPAFLLQFALHCSAQATKIVGLVDLAQVPGSTLDQQLVNAQASFSSPTKFVVSTPGSIGSPITLGTGYDLMIAANIQINAGVYLNGSNTISCTNGATVTAQSTAFVLQNNAQSVTIRDCNFSGQSNFLLTASASTSVSDISVLNNKATSGSLFYSDQATLIGALIEGNTVIYPSGVPGPSAHVYVTGQWDNVRVTSNHFFGGTSGAEWYAADAATNLSYSQITSGTNKNAVFSNNVCEALQQTCAWGSGMWRTTFSGNSADGCGDLCYDFEGSADSTMVGNTCRNAGNGCASLAYFTGFNNSALGNSFVSTNGEALIWTNNASQYSGNIQHIKIVGNDLTCTSNCAAIRLAANNFVDIQGNTITDGRLDVLPPPSRSQAGTIHANTFRFTQQATSGASASVDTGLNVPAEYQSYFVVTDNLLITDVPQNDAYCLSITSYDTSAVNTYTIDNNKCIGPWAYGFLLAGATNNTVLFEVHNNQVPMLPQITNAGTLANFGNYTLAGSHD